MFNTHELKKAAAQSIGRCVSDIKSFKKIAEGGYNRVFELVTDDDVRIIARLPYPSTVPNRFTVASEIATLDLVRSRGVPAPKLLAYPVEAGNPVGAEYIILEKVRGRSLGETWYDLTEKQRLKVTLELVRLEAKLIAIDLPASGSIYYLHDVPSHIPRTDLAAGNEEQKFCIGPDVSLPFWFEERSLLHCDRGPYITGLELLTAAAKKEIAWLQSYGRARLPFERAYREYTNYEKSQPQEHIESLEKYLQIAPYLLPRDTSLHRPVLRHPDLQPNNILVSDKYEIVGVIDWQHCSVLPLFLAAGIPKYFQNYSDDESVSHFRPPKLAPDIDQMEPAERAITMEQYRKRHLHFFYLGFTKKLNEDHFRAAEGPNLLKRRTFTHAREPWEGNSIPLKADLAHIILHWRTLVQDGIDTDLVCPISLGDEEVERCLRIERQQEEASGHLETIRNAIGLNSDGWVMVEDFKDAVDQADALREMALNAAADAIRRHWHFDDYDENG